MGSNAKLFSEKIERCLQQNQNGIRRLSAMEKPILMTWVAKYVFRIYYPKGYFTVLETIFTKIAEDERSAENCESGGLFTK